MTIEYASNWSQDYSQRSAYQVQCSANTNISNGIDKNKNCSCEYPTTPMDDRNYEQPITSRGVTTPQGLPPTSTANIVDPFSHVVRYESSPNSQATNGVMTTRSSQNQHQYTNYQVYPLSQSTVITPGSQAEIMPTRQQMNPFDATVSPPISPLMTPISPQASLPLTNYTGVVPMNPFDIFPPPPMSTQLPSSALTCQLGTDTDSITNAEVTNSTSQTLEASFWADTGFGVAPSHNNHPSSVTSFPASSTSASFPAYHQSSNSAPIELDSNSLPIGGEYYKARIATPLIGAIFSSGLELRSTLFCTASSQFVDIIGNRPVVSFTIEGGAADTAGIGCGHVLVSINTTPINDIDTAVNMVATAPRPLIMEYFIPPNLEVYKTEGQFMVKYDTAGTEAPYTPIEWKGKYVVVGDILSEPNVINMYRSKAEYDIAVKEAQDPSRKFSVKVKQFDISHSKLSSENAHISYPTERNKWYYFTIVRPKGMPIKIASKNQEELRPLYEGVLAYLAKERTMEEAYEKDGLNEQGWRSGETFY